MESDIMAAMRQHSEGLGIAALKVLAEEGSRAFTHRAVDREAGVPEGTASRYARTREALLEMAATAMFIADRETLQALEGDDALVGADDVTDVLVHAAHALLEQPERFRARVELQLEARRTPALRRHFAHARAEFVDLLARVLTDAGYTEAREFADLLVTTIDGVLYRQLVSGFETLGQDQIRELLTSVVRSRQPTN